MMFLDRSKRDRGSHLRWRLRLLVLGAALAMAGMAMERGWLVNVALGVLVLGFGLRLLERREADDADPDGDEEAEADT